MSESRLNAAQVAAVTELLRIAPVADRLGELFEAAGHQLYLVGGSVRDALLGRLQPRPGLHHLGPPGRRRGAAAAVLPVGLDDRQGVRHRRLQGGRGRRALGDRSHHLPLRRVRRGQSQTVVAFGDTLEGDLIRRDFTVNAMAVSIPGKTFVDPYGGLRRPRRPRRSGPRPPRSPRSATTRSG